MRPRASTSTTRAVLLVVLLNKQMPSNWQPVRALGLLPSHTCIASSLCDSALFRTGCHVCMYQMLVFVVVVVVVVRCVRGQQPSSGCWRNTTRWMCACTRVVARTCPCIGRDIWLLLPFVFW